MNAEQQSLWARVAAFPLDEPGSRFTYSQKLARENEWTPGHAARVIQEYRRFVLLAATAGHPVSPSQAVDEAWHLHLTYTRSYWHGLCQQVLGRPLHHEPSKGGREESAKFADWYARTLDSYRATFGEEPPTDIWPPAGDVAKPRLRRINLNRFWAVPKPRPLAWFASVGGAAFAVVLIAGCRTETGWNLGIFDLPGRAFLDTWLKIWVVCTVLAWALRLLWRGPGGVLPEGARPADPYWNACLAGGAPRATAVAATSLASREHIGLARTKDLLLVRKTEPAPEAHPIERALWNQLPDANGLPFKDAIPHVAQTCAVIDADLENRGLVLSPAANSRVRWRPFLVAFLPVLLGLVKIAVGLARDKPVAWLAILCFMASALALILLRPVRLTRRGARTLASIKSAHRPIKQHRADVNHLPLGVALFGTTVLATYGYSELANTFGPLPTNRDTGGCGSACGGGDGGGDGGGGCGGCGGD